LNQAAALFEPEVTTRPEDLRIAFFSDALPERNGTGAYYHDLLGHLAPRVAEARVMQPGGGEDWQGVSLPLPGDPTQRLAIPKAWHLRREMAALRPHVVVSVTPGPYGLLGAWLARRQGCGLLSAFHTHFEGLADLYWGPMKRRLVVGALGGANRHLFRRSGSVLVNNRTLAGVVRDLGAPAVDIMGTPLAHDFLASPVSPPPAPLRICFAGRLAAEKNIDAVLEAARALPSIPFVIGGDGPLRSRVEEAAARLGNLEYRGWLDREGLRGLLDESSLLVLPSHQETFGSVALEAMARGRPALVAASAGIQDWPGLAPGLFTLHPGEPLADAIQRLQRRPAGTLEAVAGCARRAAQRLNDETLEQWLAVLLRHARP
jgi:glycosyltransferase involved in cell wall biosynthesis